MLGKLIKHEFRATARLMLPLFGVVMLLSLFMRIASHGVFRAENRSNLPFLDILNTLITSAFIIALIIVAVFSVVLMVSRFYKNLMTDEGYLMFTLPVSIHQLLWSKLIVAAVWFIATFLVEALAIAVVALEGGMLHDLLDGFAQLLAELDAYYALNGAAFALELLVLLLLSLIVSCLNFYAPIAIGYSFSNHKTLLSVVFYFALSLFWQIVYVTLGVTGITRLSTVSLPAAGNVSAAITLAHTTLFSTIALLAFTGAVMYVLTWYMLRRHRNLQ